MKNTFLFAILILTSQVSAQNCAEYPINGQPRIFGNKVAIQRTSNLDYRIDLSISFKTRHEEMQSRVRNCYQQAKKYLLGPNSERIHLYLNEKPSLTPYVIAVVPMGHRSSTGSLVENAECSTIIHETLHFLGLMDEYHESLLKYVYDRHYKRYVRSDSALDPDMTTAKPMYDCRSIAPKGSIMSHPKRSWDLVSYPSLILQPMEQSKSLLYPAHALAILYPNCEERNPFYDICISVSTLSSADFPDQKCPTVPVECSNGAWLFAQ